jgi:hypothetical protein
VQDYKGNGGEGGIRTPDTLSGMAAFEAARFNRSRTSPRQKIRFAIDPRKRILLSILPVLI